MRDSIYLGSSPCDEDCAQVGTPDYADRALRECRAYRSQLLRVLMKARGEDTVPEKFALAIKREAHDFGTYMEVAASFDVDDEKSVTMAYWLDSNCPIEWDDEAKKELGIHDEAHP